MKFQVVKYRTSRNGQWFLGIANVVDFGYDVNFIITEKGTRIKKIWDYKLINGPSKYLEL